MGGRLDNWNRLDSQRLPATLAAPLRAGLDPSFRAAQSPARQQSLRRSADKLRGGMYAVLRGIQTKLGRPERLPAALADVAAILPRVRRDAPALLPVLARCLLRRRSQWPSGWSTAIATAIRSAG